jgi:hypothetical protein
MLLTLDGWMQLLVERTLGEALLVLRQRLHSVFAHCVQAPNKQLSPAHADTVRYANETIIACSSAVSAAHCSNSLST